MKTYPYHTPEGIIQLVEKRELDQLQDQLYRICKEGFGNDDTIGLEPADDYVLRKLGELNAANAELLERLAEARESHLAASARDVQTIQRQAIMLERFAKALGRCTFKDWFTSDDTGEVIVALDAGEVRSALSAYKSASVEPASSRDVQTIQRQAIMLERLADAARRCRHWHDTCDGVIISAVSFWNLRSALAAYESANLEPVSNPIDEAVKRMEEVPVLELNKLHFDAMDYGNFNDIEAVRARLISAAKGEQP